MIVRILRFILLAITILALAGTFLLQYYARLSCHWNWPTQSSFMRMVVLADPQMEGDAKIARLGKRAHLDLAFNDAYMRHIYHSIKSPSWAPLHTLVSYWTGDGDSWNPLARGPTHISILGDLFSSQWINDKEFDIRLRRFRSIFPDPATALSPRHRPTRTTSFSTPALAPVLINITGNHDIGYGWDIRQERIDRWEQAFGKSNFITAMDIPGTHAETPVPGTLARLHLVVLNTMLMDGPAADEGLRGQTWQFVQEASAIKDRHPQDKIVLLTHIPFHKEKGICVDPPDIRVSSDNTIIEQTMLTPNTTQWLLNHLRPDFVLNGHDHEGCDVTHILDDTTFQENTRHRRWKAYSSSDPLLQKCHPAFSMDPVSVREVTQRSMMAEFGGFSGLFEVRTKPLPRGSAYGEGAPVEFHYTACGFYNDLQVWIVIVLDMIVAFSWLGYGLVRLAYFLSLNGSSSLPSSVSRKEKLL